jgi:hypothetical protein
MPHLGELAAAKTEATGEAITFDWHGTTIACRPDLSAMPLMELAAAGDAVNGTPGEADLMTVGAAFFRFLEALIRPTDWQTFKRLCIAHGDNGDELLPLVQRLAEAVAGRPTRPSSASLASVPETSGGSTGPSPSEPGWRSAI